MSTVIGTISSKPGQLVTGYLTIGSLADASPIRVPIMILEGEQEGPCVWITGCVHGEEYGGAAAIIEFMNELDVNDVRGTIVGIPVTNPPSYNAKSRVSWIDGANLNRIFPGDATGSYSYQLATELGHGLSQTADYLLDLHSGGIGAVVPFYAIYKDDGTTAVAKSRELAKQVGCDTIWRSKGEAGLGGTMTAEAIRHDIPSVTIESGGGTLTDEHLGNYKIGIRNFLVALDVIPGEIATQESYTFISDGAFLHNREGGLFIQDCEVGDVLAKDGLIGHIINLFGETVEEIRSPYADAYIAALRGPYFPTHAGEIVAEAIPIESRE